MSTPIGLPPPGASSYTEMVSFGPNASNAPVTSPKDAVAARDHYLEELGFSPQDILIGSKEINDLIATSSQLNITLLVGIAPGGRAVTIQSIYDNLDPSNPKVIIDEQMLNLPTTTGTQKNSPTTSNVTNTQNTQTTSATLHASATQTTAASGTNWLGVNMFGSNPYVAFVTAFFDFMASLKQNQRVQGDMMCHNIDRTFEMGNESKDLIAKETSDQVAQAKLKMYSAFASIAVAGATCLMGMKTAGEKFPEDNPAPNPPEPKAVPPEPPPPPPPPPPGNAPAGVRPGPGEEPVAPGANATPQETAKYQSDKATYDAKVKEHDAYDKRVKDYQEYQASGEDPAAYPGKKATWDKQNNDFQADKAKDEQAMAKWKTGQENYNARRTQFESSRQAKIGMYNTLGQTSQQAAGAMESLGVVLYQTDIGVIEGAKAMLEAAKTVLANQSNVAYEAFKADIEGFGQALNNLDSIRAKIVEANNAALRVT